MPSTSEKISKVVQVCNVSPSVARDQMYHLMSHFGHITEMKLYPSETNPMYSSYDRKVAYIRYDDSAAADACLHLTNTVMIDRALVVLPHTDADIPDEYYALKMGTPSLPGQRQMPPNVVNQIQTVGSQQVIMTVDPNLVAAGLPPYPPLPSNTDAVRIEEIRRTVYIGNISKEATAEEFVEFINEKIGEVMYMRFASSPEELPCRYAYVELSQQASIVSALQMSGQLLFNGQFLRIQHSTQAVQKPRAKTAEAAQKEVEEAMRTANDAEPYIARVVDSEHSKSRSPYYRGGRRSRSRSPGRRRRSPHDRYHRRSRSRERVSPRRRKSRTPERKRRSRTPEKRRRSRTPEKRSSDRRRDKDRESRSKKSRSRSPSQKHSSSKEKDRDRHEKSREKEKQKDRKRDKHEKDEERKKDRSSSSKRKELRDSSVDEKGKSASPEVEKTSKKRKRSRERKEERKKKKKDRDRSSERSRHSSKVKESRTRPSASTASDDSAASRKKREVGKEEDSSGEDESSEDEVTAPKLPEKEVKKETAEIEEAEEASKNSDMSDEDAEEGSSTDDE